MSESVAKALRAGIDGEKKRGISTILFVRLGAIGAFATDSDNLRRRGPREGRHGSDGDRGGRSLTSRGAFRIRECSSSRCFREQNAHLECEVRVSASGVGRLVPRDRHRPRPDETLRPRTATALPG